MAGAGIQSFAKFRAQIVPRNAKGLRQSRGLWRSAENLRVELFGLWHFTKELAFRSILASGGWHSAVCLSAERQGL
jgi:hypothetical protein